MMRSVSSYRTGIQIVFGALLSKSASISFKFAMLRLHCLLYVICGHLVSILMPVGHYIFIFFLLPQTEYSLYVKLKLSYSKVTTFYHHKKKKKNQPRPPPAACRCWSVPQQ